MKHKATSTLLSLAVSFVVSSSVVSAAPTAAWVLNLTPTAVQDADYGGEVVETVDGGTVSGCGYTDFYAVRDAVTIKGSLALATTALVAGKQLDLYVTGSCDSSGRPLVSSINLH